MLIIAFCPHYHLEGLRRGLLRGSGNSQAVPMGWLSPLPPCAGDRQKQMNSAPLLQILFRPVVTFLRAAWTLPLRRLTGAKALILGSQTLQGREVFRLMSRLRDL